MKAWRAFATVSLAPLALVACNPAEPNGEAAAVAAAAGESRLDPYLDGYRLLEPDSFPDEAEIASGCDFATESAIAEMEAGGAIVERTFDTSVARRPECRWASDRRWLAACRFERASIPFGTDRESESGRQAYVARLRDRDWSPAAARFALVQAGGLSNAGDPPRWIATDTCEPFVFKAGDWEIDLRESVRRRRRAP
jgi:hypothetical protein